MLYFISGMASEIDTDHKMFQDVLRFLDTNPTVPDMRAYMKWFDENY